jgi:CMP-N,N'-diacetyllegionaminic acid synthase
MAVKKILGIIPARKGSKGLPGKNKKTFAGKPLICHSFFAASNSKLIDEVILSSDCDDCIKLANDYGIKVPFIRPPELASDIAKSIDVIEHAVSFLKQNSQEYEHVVLIEPTSPLREKHDIDKAIEKYLTSGAKSLVSVCKASSIHPAYMLELNEWGFIKENTSELLNQKRRQDVVDLYYPEGSIYISCIKNLLSTRTFYHKETICIEVPRFKSIEIDDDFDFYLAECTYRKYFLNEL